MIVSPFFYSRESRFSDFENVSAEFISKHINLFDNKNFFTRY